MTIAKKTASEAELLRLHRLGEFFKTNRLKAGLSVECVAQALELEIATYNGYEDGRLSMPLEDVFALTNFLNIAPEEVMDLVHEMYMLGSGAR